MKHKLKIALALCLLLFSLQSSAQVGAAIKGAFTLLKLATNSQIAVQLRNAAGVAIGAAFATTDAWKQTFSQITDAVGTFTVAVGNEIYEIVVQDSVPAKVSDTDAVSWANSACQSFIAAVGPHYAQWSDGYSFRCYVDTSPTTGDTDVIPQFSWSGGDWCSCINLSAFTGASAFTYNYPSIPSTFSNVVFLGNNGYHVYGVLPSDGKKRLVHSSSGWVADPSDIDWRGVTPPVPAPTVRFQNSTNGVSSTLDVTNDDLGSVYLKQVETIVDAVTNKTVSTVDDARLNLAGQVVSSTSNTYINVDPATLTGSGSGSVTFPDHMAVNVTNPVTIANLDGLVVNTAPDAATQTWMYNLKADTTDISRNTKKVADAFELGSSPALPDADDITQYLFPAIFDDLKAWRPQFTGTCSPVVIDTGFFAQPLTLSAHCTLLNQVGPQLRTIVSGAWLIVALFIVLAA